MPRKKLNPETRLKGQVTGIQGMGGCYFVPLGYTEAPLTNPERQEPCSASWEVTNSHCTFQRQQTFVSHLFAKCFTNKELSLFCFSSCCVTALPHCREQPLISFMLRPFKCHVFLTELDVSEYEINLETLLFLSALLRLKMKLISQGW